MTQAIPMLPRYAGTDQAIKTWADNLCSAIENAFASINAPGGRTGWQATGTVALRTINGDSATLVQTSETLNTLIVDLLDKGIITFQ